MRKLGFIILLIFCAKSNIGNAQEYSIVMTGDKSNAALCISSISPKITINDGIITFKVSGFGFSYKGEAKINEDMTFDMSTVVDLFGGKPSTFRMHGNLSEKYAVVTSSRSGCTWRSKW